MRVAKDGSTIWIPTGYLAQAMGAEFAKEEHDTRDFEDHLTLSPLTTDMHAYADAIM
jgi:hypothetical protein